MSIDKGVLTFVIDAEDDDVIKPSENFSMGEKIITTRFPDDMDLTSIHPDHIALAVLMIVNPFVGKRLILPKGMSQSFFDKHKSLTSRYDFGPIDKNLKPWVAKKDSRPGLAFSGGVDSTAALSVMPPSTAPVFLDRPIKSKSLYNKDAAHSACSEIAQLGYDLHMIECDLEYVRSPTGFPVDVANSVPIVLMAEYLNLDCIGFGTILESTYGTGHKKARDYPNGNHFRFWGGLFEVAGLPFILPVAGISEVGTSIIVTKSPLGEYAQSCMRGEWKKPCLNCWKCFRKQILDWAILGESPLEIELINLFNNVEAHKYVSEIPIKHENVLTWSTNKLNLDDNLFKLLKERVRGDSLSLEFLERWYSPALEIIPEKYKIGIKEKILIYLEVMTNLEEKEVENWSMIDFISLPETGLSSERLSKWMAETIKSR